MPSRVYASTAYLSDPPGALYMSTDRGSNWGWVGLTNSNITSLGGTPLEMRGANVLAGWGALLSGTNQATSWTTLGTFTDQRMSDIFVNPTNSNHIYVLSDHDTTHGGFLNITTNGGSSWSTHSIVDGTVGPSSSNVVDVTLSGRVLVATSGIAGPTVAPGLYYSDNSGVTWDRFFSGLSAWDVVVDRANPGVVYAAVDGDLYRSATSGSIWTPLTTPMDGSVRRVATDSMGRIFVGTASVAGAGGLYYSTDSGANWTPCSPGVQSGEAIYQMEMDPAGCYLYTATMEGVERFWIAAADEIYGADRFATAIAVSKAAYGKLDDAASAVICSGMGYADAVVAAPLAAQVNGPILLSGTSGLSTAMMAEVDRVLPAGATIYLVGGTAVVPASVKTALEAKGYTVVRLGGADRYATSALVAEEITAPTAFVIAYGGNFPDALSASAPAAVNGIPVLLTSKTALPPSVAAYLAAEGPFGGAYIVGDETVVSAGVASAIDPHVSGPISRFAGDDRYDTSLAIAEGFYGPIAHVGIATGANYPDALTGAALCALNGGPMLLTPPTSVRPDAAGYLADYEPAVTIFGGRSAVSVDARYAIEALW